MNIEDLKVEELIRRRQSEKKSEMKMEDLKVGNYYRCVMNKSQPDWDRHGEQDAFYTEDYVIRRKNNLLWQVKVNVPGAAEKLKAHMVKYYWKQGERGNP